MKDIKSSMNLVFIALFLVGCCFLMISFPGIIGSRPESIRIIGLFMNMFKFIFLGGLLTIIGGAGIIINYYFKRKHHITQFIFNVVTLAIGLNFILDAPRTKGNALSGDELLVIEKSITGFICSLIGFFPAIIGGIGLLVQYIVFIQKKN